MILLLDVGNTRLKWATWDGGRVQVGGAQPHQGDPASSFFSLAPPQAQQVWVSQVLGADAERALGARIREHLGVAPRFARTELDRDGLHVAYRDAHRLGVDRWLCMLALWTRLHAPFCVAQAGTAVTFDAVDDGGTHLGGLIGPGLLAAQQAVLATTRFETRAQALFTTGLGRDTDSCVRQGALHACAGLIERAARHGSGERFITGGDAATLLPQLPGAQGWQWRPHLVFEGLIALARSEGAR